MFNKVILSGRLTADPELKTTGSGIYVTSFNIAVERRFKNENGEREADFITIVAWRGTAEFVSKHFKKGDMIGIEGSIQTRKFTDKNGNNRTAFEVVADNVDFVGGKKDSSEAPAQTQATVDPFPTEDDPDVPF
jgi:single-strand DNA-binding protein